MLRESPLLHLSLSLSLWFSPVQQCSGMVGGGDWEALASVSPATLCDWLTGDPLT